MNKISSESIQQGWLNTAVQCCSPNYDQRPNQTDIDLIVIHSISLPPGVYGNSFIDDLFCNTLDPKGHEYFQSISKLKVSAHLLIKRDGSITQYVNFLHRAWHAGVSSYEGKERCNDFSIGIELEGLEGDIFEDSQYQSLSKTVKTLIHAFPKLSEQRICGHSDIAPGRKQDPGDGFDWQHFNTLLQQQNAL